MFNINLEEVDTDGAIRQAAEDCAGDSRLGFLKKAGLAGGAFMGGGAILAALAPSAMAAALSGGVPPASVFGTGDLAILRFALTLEYLERGFYEEATSKKIATGAKNSGQLGQFLRTVTTDEKAHVAFLTKALGSNALKEPKFDFKAGLTSSKVFAETAYALENTGVKAYLGQAGNIKTPAYLLAAASIVTIEARHSGAIGLYLGKAISANGAFDPYTTSASTIVGIVDSTKFVTKLYPI